VNKISGFMLVMAAAVLGLATVSGVAAAASTKDKGTTTKHVAKKQAASKTAKKTASRSVQVASSKRAVQPLKDPVLHKVVMPEDPSARTPKPVPVRAYARDGASFYQNGELIRVSGLGDDAPAGGELAKQRLQQLLDGGDVSIRPLTAAGGGDMLAEVRVNGRDVADMLRGSN
jgi:hypothetical protein